MPAVDIRLDLPDHILDGITSGKFLRDGSVIVNADNHQVVCWLDEVVSYGVEGFPDVVQLLQVGGSFLLDKASERRLARIEEKLNEISLDVKELINLQHDAIFAEARASMSDLQRRLRTGEEITPDLLRDLEKAWIKMDRLLVRTATEGVERALDDGGLGKMILRPWRLWTADMPVNARRGPVGAGLSALIDSYVALSLSFAVAISSKDHQRLPALLNDLCSTLPRAATGLVRLAGNRYWYLNTKHMLLWSDSPVPDSSSAQEYASVLSDWAVQIATDDFRSYNACKKVFVPNIQRGLLTCAEFLDLVDTGGLVREIERIPARLADQGI